MPVDTKWFRDRLADQRMSQRGRWTAGVLPGEERQHLCRQDRARLAAWTVDASHPDRRHEERRSGVGQARAHGDPVRVYPCATCCDNRNFRA